MTAEILNYVHTEQQGDFLLRDILPGAAWAPYTGRDLAFAGQLNFVYDAGAEESGWDGLQYALPFEA
jgi:hypothetical protein